MGNLFRSQILNSLLKDARGSDNGRRHLALLSLAELAMLVDLKRLPDLHDLLLVNQYYIYIHSLACDNVHRHAIFP